MVKWLNTILVTPEESDNFYHFHDNRVLPPNVDQERAKNEGALVCSLQQAGSCSHSRIAWASWLTQHKLLPHTHQRDSFRDRETLALNSAEAAQQQQLCA